VPLIKSVGKSVGKNFLKTGMNIASDVLQGAPLKESLEQRSKAAGIDMLDSLSDRLSANEQRSQVRRKRSASKNPSATPKAKRRKRGSKQKRDIFS
jgi:hypothetical protein